MKYLNNEKGVALALELIVLAILLSVAGFAGYQYMSHKNPTNQATNPNPNQTSKSPAPTPTPTAKPATKTDAYSGWKTYTSKTEGLSFKYPADWAYKNTGSADPSADGGAFSSPSGMEIVWDSAISGLGGACNPDTDPHVFFHQLTQITAIPKVYVLESGQQSSIQYVSVIEAAVPLKIGDTGTCMYYPLFKSKDGKRNMLLQGRVAPNGNVQMLTSDQTAEFKKILLSLSY